jgi:hypothetical protein
VRRLSILAEALLGSCGGIICGSQLDASRPFNPRICVWHYVCLETPSVGSPAMYDKYRTLNLTSLFPLAANLLGNFYGRLFSSPYVTMVPNLRFTRSHVDRLTAFWFGPNTKTFNLSGRLLLYYTVPGYKCFFFCYELPGLSPFQTFPLHAAY